MKKKTKINVKTVKKPLKKRGPKTKYNPRYDIVARKLIAKGKTCKEVYDILGITEPTGIKWKKEQKTFKQAFIDGRKELKNNLVEHSLLKTALGFHEYVGKALVVSDGKDLGAHVEKVRVKEYFPPNIGAIKYFLNNRKPLSEDPDGWAEKQSIEHSGTVNYKIIPDDELEPEKEKK
jgi:hypothetical protein